MNSRGHSNFQSSPDTWRVRQSISSIKKIDQRAVLVFILLTGLFKLRVKCLLLLHRNAKTLVSKMKNKGQKLVQYGILKFYIS